MKRLWSLNETDIFDTAAPPPELPVMDVDPALPDPSEKEETRIQDFYRFLISVIQVSSVAPDMFTVASNLGWTSTDWTSTDPW